MSMPVRNLLTKLSHQPCRRAISTSPRQLARYDPKDALRLDTLLTSEEMAIRDTARDYAQSSLEPRVNDAWINETFDRKIMTELGELGLLGATIDGYGCAGVSSVAYGLIVRHLEAFL
jgi:glutaryl-CoA dehydrogenase